MTNGARDTGRAADLRIRQASEKRPVSMAQRCFLGTESYLAEHIDRLLADTMMMVVMVSGLPNEGLPRGNEKLKRPVRLLFAWPR